MPGEVVLEISEPSAVAAARRRVAELLPDGGSDLADSVRLAVSELLSNALVHGRPPVIVMARADEQSLRIEVADASPERGSPQQASATASSGRGLAIVDAVAHRWGIEARGEGKAVWLEFCLTPAPEPEVGVVHLLGLPVATYLRSQNHLDDTLYELDVLAASDSTRFGSIQATTVNPLRQAMEVFGEMRRAGRAHAQAALSAGHSSVDFTWNLPRQAAQAARVYGQAVAELDRLARSGALLTPPPDPEVTALRQWLADEIAAQLITNAAPSAFALFPKDA